MCVVDELPIVVVPTSRGPTNYIAGAKHLQLTRPYIPADLNHYIYRPIAAAAAAAYMGYSSQTLS